MNENITETMRGISTNLGGTATGATTYEVCKEVYEAAKGTKGEVTVIQTYLGDNLYADSDNQVLIVPKKYMDYSQVYYQGDGGSDGKTYTAFTYSESSKSQAVVGTELAYIQWVGSYLEVLAKPVIKEVGEWTYDASTYKWTTTVKFDITLGTVTSSQSYNFRIYKRLSVDGMSYATIVGVAASGVTSSVAIGCQTKTYGLSSVSINPYGGSCGSHSVAINGSCNTENDLNYGNVAINNSASYGERNVMIGKAINNMSYVNGSCVGINGDIGVNWNTRVSNAVAINGTAKANNSIAIGGSVQQNAYNGIAIGSGAQLYSSSQYAIAIGNQVIAENSGQNDILIGKNIKAYNYVDNIIGIGVNVSGGSNAFKSQIIGMDDNLMTMASGCTVVGHTNTVQGRDCKVIGNRNTNNTTSSTSRINQVIIGNDNNLKGQADNAIFVGSSNEMVGSYTNADMINVGNRNTELYDKAICIGNDNVSNQHTNVICIGNNLDTTAFNSTNDAPTIALGAYNRSPLYANQASLVIGGGSSAATRTNLLEIYANGDIYIKKDNSSTASYKLQSYLLPAPPATGTWVLKAVDGEVKWVEES